MKMSGSIRFLVAFTWVLVLPALAAAQTEPATPEATEGATETERAEGASGQAAKPAASKPLKTVPPDQGFGQHQLAEHQKFDIEPAGGRVDRRSDIDSMSDRAILWPTAYVPEAGKFSFTNYSFFGNQASFAVTDSAQVTATFVIPMDEVDLSTGLSGKFVLTEGADWVVSTQPFFMYHAGQEELDVKDLGAGLGLLADLYVLNDLVVGAGLYGYGTIFFAADRFDYSECESRRDFLDGTCTRVVSDTEFGPSGGHWLAGNVNATWYIYDSLSLRFEAFSGVGAGTVLGLDYIYQAEESISEQAARYEDGDVDIGVPYGRDITLGGGLAWSEEQYGLQLSGYAYRGDPNPDDDSSGREWLLTPMFNGTVAF